MKIIVFPDAEGNCSIHYRLDLLTEEEKVRGIELDSLPVKDILDGKRAVLKGNKVTGEVYYEYVDDTEIVKLQGLLNDALSLLEETEVL